MWHDPREGWPQLPYERLKPTTDTLQRLAQIVGKVRLARTPWTNHSWHVTLFVSARGLVTPLIPAGRLAFTLELDFIAHALVVRVVDGGERRIPLASGSVASFYDEVQAALEDLDVATTIDARPNELPDETPFRADVATRPYDPHMAYVFWRALVQIDRVFHRFRSGFLGKTSPPQFFWGSFDYAVTRFSGRPAPPHPGGVPHLPDAVVREAYSHEVSSAGFWPGGQGVETPAFYAYAYPEPKGFAEWRVSPAEARYQQELGEFVLPYEAVCDAPNPEARLLEFLHSTYAAAADLGGWDRAALECEEGRPGVPRPVPSSGLASTASSP